MKRLILIGTAVLVLPTLALVLIVAAMGGWNRYYWAASPDLAKAFRAAASDAVRAEPLERLVGASIEAARAEAEASGFSCLPRQELVQCERFVSELDCDEEWDLVLETADGRVSGARGTKRVTCVPETD